jgi:hypothetical protein
VPAKLIPFSEATEIFMCNQSHEQVETALIIVKDGDRELLIIQSGRIEQENAHAAD